MPSRFSIALYIFDGGKLVKLEDCTEEGAKNHADFIMAPEANTWKKILRKLDKFVGAFMGQRIKLEKGDTVKALGLAPHANTLVDSLTQVKLKFPDELSPDELEEFKSSFAEYREKTGV